jgi:hypothetical protein
LAGIFDNLRKGGITMKKVVLLLMSLFLMTVLVNGCGQKEEPQTETTVEQTAPETEEAPVAEEVTEGVEAEVEEAAAEEAPAEEAVEEATEGH